MPRSAKAAKAAGSVDAADTADNATITLAGLGVPYRHPPGAVSSLPLISRPAHPPYEFGKGARGHFTCPRLRRRLLARRKSAASSYRQRCRRRCEYRCPCRDDGRSSVAASLGLPEQLRHPAPSCPSTPWPPTSCPGAAESAPIHDSFATGARLVERTQPRVAGPASAGRGNWDWSGRAGPKRDGGGGTGSYDVNRALLRMGREEGA